MAEEKPARYEGAYVPRISQDEVDAVYEMASMQPRYDHPAPGKVVPSVRDVTRDARKEAEDKVRRRRAPNQRPDPSPASRPPASCWLTRACRPAQEEPMYGGVYVAKDVGLVEQRGQSAPLVGAQLGSCASSGRASWL